MATGTATGTTKTEVDSNITVAWQNTLDSDQFLTLFSTYSHMPIYIGKIQIDFQLAQHIHIYHIPSGSGSS